ncbi:MAG TPA: DUF3108 domain-containing protein [candidate division Zixibacteria bacterium]|nr:DUF3108 domain-containing protein [candidate division Zixibacteria bacterium]
MARVTAFCLLIGLFLPSALAAGETSAAVQVPLYAPRYFPFQNGEKAVYHASWNGIPVGSAEVQTRRLSIEGKPFFAVRVDARTSRVLDLVWKMRDTISSVFDARSLAPSRYVFNQRENQRVIDTDARYDPVAKKWSVDRRQKGKKPRIYEFDGPNTLDPISAVYLARSVDFKVGDRLLFHVFGGRYRYLLELTVERREPVAVGNRAVEAFRIVPKVTNLTKKGYAGRLNEATIWISADERRIPVKLTSRIFVGSVEMELAEGETGLRPTATAAAGRPG